MITNDKIQIGIVTECYDHNETHRILVVRSQETPLRQFFYIPKHPDVSFGDKIRMNFTTNKFHVFRGNSRLSYLITPTLFPGTLLWELILDQLNPEGTKNDPQ